MRGTNVDSQISYPLTFQYWLCILTHIWSTHIAISHNSLDTHSFSSDTLYCYNDNNDTCASLQDQIIIIIIVIISVNVLCIYTKKVSNKI
jgi:hypothetical protein